MIINHLPEDEFGITRVLIYPDERHEQARMRHEVICSEFDYDHALGVRVPPTAKIHLLGTGNSLCFEDMQCLAADYAVIADIAMRLESERRAEYAARYGEAIRSAGAAFDAAGD